MDAEGMADAVGNCDPESLLSEQFLPPAKAPDEDETASVMPADPVDRLRAELRRLAADVAVIDRRDATQHGGLKGEIAHLVRRIARLEALPKARQAR